MLKTHVKSVIFWTGLIPGEELVTCLVKRE